MKKRSIKNLNLNKRSISNLSNKEVKGIKGGTIVVATTIAMPCWSLLSCPTNDCTNGEICSSIECMKDILKDAQ